MRRALCLVCVASAVLPAGGITAPSDPLRGLVDAGVAHFQAEEFTAALEAFREAEALARPGHNKTTLLLNIARCLDRLGRAEEAIVGYERYLALPHEARLRRKALGRVAALVAATYGGLQVRCEPPGAGLKLLGPTPRAGTCPAHFERMLPGDYQLELFHGGHKVAGRALTIEAGQTETVALRAQDGELRVDADVKGATVYVDGRASGQTPLRRTLPVGAHVVRVVAFGHRPWHTEVSVAPDGVRRINATLVPLRATVEAEAPSLWQHSGPWILGGLTAGALVAGALLFKESLDDRDAADAAYARYLQAASGEEAVRLRRKTNQLDDEAQTTRAWSIGLLGVSALLGASTAWLSLGDGRPTALIDAETVGLGWRWGW